MPRSRERPQWCGSASLGRCRALTSPNSRHGACPKCASARAMHVPARGRNPAAPRPPAAAVGQCDSPPGMHQREHGPRQEAVVDEVVFSTPAPRTTLEIAGAIASDAVARVKSCARPGADGVGLHEPSLSMARLSVVGVNRLRSTAYRRRSQGTGHGWQSSSGSAAWPRSAIPLSASDRRSCDDHRPHGPPHSDEERAPAGSADLVAWRAGNTDGRTADRGGALEQGVPLA